MSRADLLPAVDRAERELLLDLLAERPTAVRFGRDVDEARFLEIVPEALYPLVCSHLRRATETDAPQTLLATLAAHYRGNVMLMMKRRAMLRTAIGIFERAAIPFVALKGTVLAHTVYRDPVTRTMSDLDFLVQPADLERASQAFLDAGFSVPYRARGSVVGAGEAPPLVHSSDETTLIELHSLLDAAGSDLPAFEAIWSRRRDVQLLGDLSVSTLAPEDFFADVVLHTSKHHRFESLLRGVLDVALLMRANLETFDWPALRDEWKRMAVDRWMCLTMVLAHDLLGAPLPAALDGARADVEEALPLAASQLWWKFSDRFPTKIVFALEGHMPARVHHDLDFVRVPYPRGFAGIVVRARRHSLRVMRLFSSLGKGKLRPSHIAAARDLFRKRERLAKLMGSE